MHDLVADGARRNSTWPTDQKRHPEQQVNSNREDFPVYNGPEMFAYKWRNWKLHFVSQDSMLSPVTRGVMPALYNLLTDPKEEYNMSSEATWVLPVLFKKIVAFQQTLQEEPPIQLGTPDPYKPR